SLLAEYINQKEQQTAIAIYGLTYCMIAIVYNLMWNYALNRQMTIPGSNKDYLKAIKKIYNIGIFFPLAGLVISFFNIWLALVVFGIMFIVYAFPGIFAEKVMRWNTRNLTPIPPDINLNG